MLNHIFYQIQRHYDVEPYFIPKTKYLVCSSFYNFHPASTRPNQSHNSHSRSLYCKLQMNAARTIIQTQANVTFYCVQGSLDVVDFVDSKKQVCSFAIFRSATREKLGLTWPHRSQPILRFESVVVENDQYTSSLLFFFSPISYVLPAYCHIVWSHMVSVIFFGLCYSHPYHMFCLTIHLAWLDCKAGTLFEVICGVFQSFVKTPSISKERYGNGNAI